MKIPQFVTLLILGSAFHAWAGTLSYVAIPPAESDSNSGISNASQFTTAVAAGNASGAPRVLNGVTFYPLAISGPSASADNCALNALSGSLLDVSRASTSTSADGTFQEVLSNMTVNQGAADNSQQEIVLDPASLTAGATYDLRIYLASSGANQDREVNLSFVGDGQPPAETGFFNEEDARTAPGGFRDPNQVYYINYRFTWDGDSTPGVTVTQKSGQAPFALYALTNQAVVENAAATPAPAEIAPPVAPALEIAAAPAISAAETSAVPDRVGVTSDTFYSNQSLKKHGRWVDVKKYGRAWQPTNYSPDWRPYSHGHFVYSDDGGYTWISDADEDDWSWAVYHYGRWCRVKGVGCGWAWVPGTAWSGAWVSWRQGKDREHVLVGWAPLPPEATLRVGVGISTWADREYDIGPDYYTFVHARDFGADSYGRPGIVVDRQRYPELMANTVNITNINYTRTNGNGSTNVTVTQIHAYNGGPNFTFINTQIREHGGREIPLIRIDRVGTENFAGGAGRRFQNNTLTVFAPPVVAEAKPKVLPIVAATVPDSKIDHGWAELKDPKLEAKLKTEIAEQTKGKTPATTKAVLPPQVLQAVSTAPSPLGATPPPAGSPAATPATQIIGVAPMPSVTPPAVPSATAALAKTTGSPGLQLSVPVKALHPGEKIAPVAIARGGPTATPSGATTPATSAAAITSALPTAPGPSPVVRALRPGQKMTSPAPSPIAERKATSPTVATSPAIAAKETAAVSPLPSPSIAAASPTPVTADQSPGPGKVLHPGERATSRPAQTLAPTIAGATPSPTAAAQRPLVVAAKHQNPASPTPTSPAITQTTASPANRRDISHDQLIQKEKSVAATPVPTQPHTLGTPALTTRRTPTPLPVTTQSPTPVISKKVAPLIAGKESVPPAGPSEQRLKAVEEQKLREQKQQLEQQQIEQRLRQQQHQKQEENKEVQQQQQLQQERAQEKTQEEGQQKQAELKKAQQEQTQAEGKKRQLEQQQAQQKQLEEKKKSQEANQQKQAEQKKAQQEQAQAEQKRELQQQAGQQKQKQAEQERKLQQQTEQKKQEQEQARKSQQQAEQKKAQQEQAQRQQQQQIEQRIRQQQQQKQQEQAEQKIQQQQAEQRQLQQQNRRSPTPTPTPSPGQ
ncbi:MAG: hypothetical protein M3R59_04545 [Verrucomicrobiota bacterium]|nr:hypothetical protein [Verrucomicrobiota bacterium]